MRVKLSTWYEGSNPGDEIDVDDAQGRVMINDGQARETPPEADGGTETETKAGLGATPTPTGTPPGNGTLIPPASPDASKMPDPGSPAPTV